MTRRDLALETSQFGMQFEGEFVWRSLTNDFANSTNLIGLLVTEPLYIRDSKYTPFSDIRIVLAIAFLYLISISLLRRVSPLRFATSRPFVAIAAFHNASLCIASLVMLVGLTSAVAKEVSSSGSFASSVCNPTGKQMGSDIGFWLYLFYLSKFWELLDTVLLVLRGKPLTILHVWHHTSVMFEMFSWLEFSMVLGVYGMMFNTLVHVFMYAYYAAALLNIRVPWKRALTSLQILQFCVSFVSLIPYYMLHAGTPDGCTGGPGLIVSIVCNGSFLILFIDFFRKTYSAKSQTRVTTKVD